MNEDLRFVVVAHTHWDREWYAPLEHFRIGLAHVVDGVIDTLENDPSFRSFTLDGQAIVLEDYLELRPEREPRLRALLAAGRLVVGPSYVLPDEFLVGAEPLVRNLLLGRAVCERFGARPAAVGYMPDSFGHPQQLPQILAGFGIRSFVFSRGLGDELDDAGVIFGWRAPDGSEVLAFQQLPHYDNFAGIADPQQGERRVHEILAQFGAALARAGVRDVLLCNGSDHLPINAQLPALCSELEARMPGTRFEVGSAGEYVERVGHPQVPHVSGELLGSRLQNVLRGVNSARLYIKQANERAEQRLLAVETLAALRTLREGIPFPGGDLRLAWRELLRCHPHDTICGCSCDEVHRDALARYESLHRTLSAIERRALESGERATDRAEDSGGAVSIFNTLPYRRRVLVEPAGVAPVLVELDGFASGCIEPVAAPAPRPPAAGTVIENERFRVEAGADGTLALLDKHHGRQLEHLHLLEDELDMGDLYNFCPVAGAVPWCAQRARVRVLSAGPLIFELEIAIAAERPAGLNPTTLEPLERTAPLRVTTVVRLVAGSDRVELRTTIENAARDHRLRVRFPLQGAIAAAGPVRAEGQFTVVRRALSPPAPRSAWVEPPDATQHTLGAVALGPLAVITKGLPEYEAGPARPSAGAGADADADASADGARGAGAGADPGAGVGAELAITLLRCVGLISRGEGELVTRPRSAGPRLPTPEAQCLGTWEAHYALRSDADLLSDRALLRASQDYRCAPVMHRPAAAGAAALTPSLPPPPPLALEGDVVFSCLKGAQDGDGLIMRCFNPSGEPVSARIAGAVTVGRTRMDETGEQPLPGGLLELTGGQVVTLRLRRSA